MVRQLETSMTDIVNILIQMNQKFLPETKAYRILGDDVDFKEFTNESKQVRVDARVEIEPKQEKGPEKRKAEVLELYKIFITEDQPTNPEDAEQMKEWTRRKKEMQKMVLDEYDKSQYEEVLLGLESIEEAEQDREEEDDENAVGNEVGVPSQRVNREPIPLVDGDAPVAPTGPIPNGAPPAGFLQKLLGRLRG
jgi:hypothetical protein